MPDPVLILQAAGMAILAAAIVLVAGRPWRTYRQPAAFAAFGVGAGWFVGAMWLGYTPRWKFAEDQDRLLLIVLPAAVVVELAAIALGRRVWVSWMLRAVLSLAVARVILSGSIYISDVAGPNTAEWQGYRYWAILGGLGASLIASWASLSWLARRETGPVVLPALAIVAGAAGATVMLSGYASGGPLGVFLAAALGPAVVAGFIWPRSRIAPAALGVGLVGLFGFLISGRFFASLATTNAIVLFAAPQIVWLMELPRVRRLRPWLRQLAGAMLVMMTVTAVVILAVRKFNEASRPTPSSGGTPEPTIEDYLNYHK